jgi:hypothetical protein
LYFILKYSCEIFLFCVYFKLIRCNTFFLMFCFRKYWFTKAMYLACISSKINIYVLLFGFNNSFKKLSKICGYLKVYDGIYKIWFSKKVYVNSFQSYTHREWKNDDFARFKIVVKIDFTCNITTEYNIIMIVSKLKCDL